MKKTVLMLINGFGIQRKDSTEVFSGSLMPNLDALTRSELFSSLETTAQDYNGGYKMFSIPEKSKHEESELDNMIYEKSFANLPLVQEILSQVNENDITHIFYATDNATETNTIKEIVKILNNSRDKKVYVHFILNGQDASNYPQIQKCMDKIAFETGGYCKLGLVVGGNKFNTPDTLRALYREQGEHWNESHKKIELLTKNSIKPQDVGVFHINSGFALKENSQVIFLNFSKLKIDYIYEDISKMNLKVYSLYELRPDIKNILNYTKGANNSYADIVTNFNIRSLVLTSNDRINNINFYLNGMENFQCPNINYAINSNNLFATKQNAQSVLSNPGYDIVILDYEIGNHKQLGELKNELAAIDGVIKNISEVCRENNYSFIISSLYGMHSTLQDNNASKIVNFEGKVPCIYQSNEFTKTDYSLNPGNIYDLAQTILTNTNDEVKNNRLIHKMSPLEKLLRKK